MSAIRRLVANTGVQAIVIVVDKIVGDAGLRVDQIGKNGREHQKVRCNRGQLSAGLI